MDYSRCGATRLAARSLSHRRVPLLLTLITLILSLTLVFGVQYLRTEVRNTFMSTVSGTDLIVGARSGPVNLLLYSVFHIGNPTNNIRWSTFQHVAGHDAVQWAVPISLGDSHKGFRVVATSRAFFERYRYGDDRALAFGEGEAFRGVYEAVVGQDVARRLGYGKGDSIVVAHGAGSTSFVHHDKQPFTVEGVLRGTGTPLDRVILIPLEGFEAIHAGWRGGVQVGAQPSPAEALERDLTPEQITAMLVGAERRIMTLRLQRELNNYEGEPLTAILPGATLARLWQMLGGFENALLVISALVLVTSLVGMVGMLLATQSTRTREMAILRSIGATPWGISFMYVLECLLLVGVALVLALLIWFGGLRLVAPWLSELWGIHIGIRPPGGVEAIMGATVMGLSLLVSLVPAWLGYRRSLAAGLTPRE
ncbi:MAG: ABC transporter permease [Pseudomonadota bacterium]